MKDQYKPKTLEQKMGYLIEEAGETMAAIGKAQRWGLFSVNPELPTDQQETNIDWMIRELADLGNAVYILSNELNDIKADTQKGQAEP